MCTTESAINLSRGFSRADESAPDNQQNEAAFLVGIAVSPGKPIPRQETIKKKRKLFPGLPLASPPSIALPH